MLSYRLIYSRICTLREKVIVYRYVSCHVCSWFSMTISPVGSIKQKCCIHKYNRSALQFTCFCLFVCFQVSRKGGKSQERMFFLFSDMLIYGKPKLLDSGNSSYSCCCVLPLRHCTVERVLGSVQRTDGGGMFRVC